MPYVAANEQILINETLAGSQSGLELIALANGNFLASWYDVSHNSQGQEVVVHLSRFFDPSGVPLGQEFTRDYGIPVVLQNGNMVALIEQGEELWAQLIDGSGAPLDVTFMLNTGTTGTQNNATIAALANGGFVALWTSTIGSQSAVRGQIFDADGVKIGGELPIAPFAQGFEQQVDVAALPTGGFATTTMSGLNLIVKRYSSAGVVIGEAVVVNDIANEYPPVESKVTALTGGGFVVTWVENASSGGWVILGALHAQLFDAAGNKVGDDIVVSAEGPDQVYSYELAGLANGEWVITWANREDQASGDDTNVVAQVFDSRGSKVGGEILVNTILAGDQFGETVTALASGGFAIGWSDLSHLGGDNSGGAVAGRVFDFVEQPVGSPGADYLLGSDYDDTLAGLAGNDVLEGGLGNDSLDGGADRDVASYASAAGAVTVSLLRTSAQNTGGAGIDTLVSIEGLIGSTFGDSLTGSNGDDMLDGGAGADTLKGGTGNDRYVIDNAGDKIIELNGQGGDTVDASVTFSLAGQYLEALNLIGTAAINGSGNSLDNRIIGNSAANALNGAAGNDRLDGGAGADKLIGGIGNDVFVVDNAGDVIVENNGEGTDTVEASISYSIAGQYIETLKLTGTANINATGNGQANTLTGNGGNNVLNGGGGADTMAGGAGNDRYIVDNALDKVSELTGEGIDTVEASVTFTIAGQHIEELRLTGTAAIDGSGNSLANTMWGNGAANKLNGSTGDDALHGGLGSDTLTGGAGADHFWFESDLGAANIDTITDFSAADDTIDLDRSIFTGIAANGVLDAGAFRLGTTALDADDRILYDKATGNLWYDPDGAGGTYGAVLFAKVTANTNLTAADFFGSP